MTTAKQLVIETNLGGDSFFITLTFKYTISVWPLGCIFPKNIRDNCDFFAMFDEFVLFLDVFVRVLSFCIKCKRFFSAIHTRFFYKEPTSRPSSKSSLFIDLNSANCSTKSSLIVP